MMHKLSKDEFRKKVLKNQEKARKPEPRIPEIELYIATRYAQYLHNQRHHR